MLRLTKWKENVIHLFRHIFSETAQFKGVFLYFNTDSGRLKNNIYNSSEFFLC